MGLGLVDRALPLLTVPSLGHGVPHVLSWLLDPWVKVCLLPALGRVLILKVTEGCGPDSPGSQTACSTAPSPTNSRNPEAVPLTGHFPARVRSQHSLPHSSQQAWVGRDCYYSHFAQVRTEAGS